jgi:hypothetical protein
MKKTRVVQAKTPKNIENVEKIQSGSETVKRPTREEAESPFSSQKSLKSSKFSTIVQSGKQPPRLLTPVRLQK